MKPWTWRHAIINSELPPTTRHVLLTLSCHVNDAGEPAYPSTALLAAETGLSERAVVTHLRDAAGLGWLTVEKHGYGGQRWARNQYYPRLPDGFELVERDVKRTEAGSVPQKTGHKTKALNDVQQPVDKGTEAGSVPQEKALNVVPEGTEPNDRKALNDVQSNTAVNPAKKAAAHACEKPAAAAAQKIGNVKTDAERELGELLIALERERGHELVIDRGRGRTHIVAWVGKGVTPDQLRAAHALAVAARKRDSDERPTYAGFVSTFVDEAMAPAAVGPADPMEWHLTQAGTEARGAELGMRERKQDEDWRYYRVLVVRASREPRAIEHVLADAQRFNAIDLYQFARATFGDALMPVDDFAS
ncbi:helix-turn-helix domain-containing protein [Burkholderia contaminans]|uniref:helix-turn-helix domain-containing protein n=1 Tax=Burkholderia TaxID=32008 RepID=UPI0014859938|nr:MULTISPECIES: helix-turn-helix domain-containing protein [unclassified Burkholderia]MBM6427871.1 helix-turn-helix domain-containing protein [Burkholderia contaminans]